MNDIVRLRFVWLGSIALTIGGVAIGCASDPKPAVTPEEVRDGDALPPAPAVPAEPASTNSPTAPTVPEGSAAATPPPGVEALSEAQIARLGELVNHAEIDQAKLAKTKAKAADVRKFADMMIKHHGQALTEQAKLVKQLKITPADSETGGKLKADADKTLDDLKKASAVDFDAAYVQSQIDGHENVLNLIDSRLLPNAKDPQVSDALRQARAAVAQHLEQARALQKKK